MVRDLLNRVRNQRYMIDACVEDLKQARRDAISLKAVRIGDKVQSSHQSDLSEILERIEKYETRLQDSIDELTELKLEAQSVIEMEEDLRARAVLYRRYILAESWDVISAKMHYSRYQLMRISDESIEMLEKMPHIDTSCNTMQHGKVL